MARKQTNTVEYFPHIAKQGKTIFILESKYKNDGYAFWFKLLELLCQSEGHFIDCKNESSWQYLIAQSRVDEITGSEILSLLSNMGNIDSELWKYDKIIWCDALIENIKDVYTRRGRAIPTKPKSNNLPQKLSSGVISEEEILAENDFRIKSTQSKVNEIKVKKKEEKLKEERKIFLEWESYVRDEMEKLLVDEKWIAQMEKDYPGVNIRRTTQKCFEDYFITEEGYKKRKGNPNCNWKAAMNYQLGPKGGSRVFNNKPKQSGYTNEDISVQLERMRIEDAKKRSK